jgi:CRP/FNR family transcriptional regulator, cyclic AMP receptor protein
MSTFRMFLNQESKSFVKGDTIFQKGDPADRMYIIAEGEVEISIGDRVAEVLGAEMIFGEMALVTHEPRSGAARARTDCQLVEIPERRFLFLTQQTPNFALDVMRVIAERLRRRDPVS